VETKAAKDGDWLRTGDLARIDKEGNIYLTGRSKYIIVLDSGEKVYPDEVEEHLAASPLLADVCVTGTKQRDRTTVTAVIHPDRDIASATDSEAALRATVEAEVARLCRDLVGYKRVSTVVLRDSPLPRTVLQKVARGQVDASTSFSFEKWRNGAEALEAQGSG
jgi:long-chain acyl-CoA synthetase